MQAISRKWSLGERFRMHWAASSEADGGWFTGRVVGRRPDGQGQGSPWGMYTVVWEDEEDDEDEVSPWEMHELSEQHSRWGQCGCRPVAAVCLRRACAQR